MNFRIRPPTDEIIQLKNVILHVVENWEQKSLLHVVENWDGVQLAVVALADDWRTPLLAH